MTARAAAFRTSACRSPTSATLDRALVVGSFLRKDQPLLAHRLRQAAKKGAQISSLHSVDDDWLMPIAHRAIVVRHRDLPAMLAQIVVAAAQGAGKDVPAALAGASKPRRQPT